MALVHQHYISDVNYNDVKYKVAVLLDIFIGARLGELAGLEWSDIDLNNGIISINKSSQYLSDKGIFTKILKQKVQFVKSLFLILSFLYSKNINYGTKNKNQLYAIFGTILIGYLYR